MNNQQQQTGKAEKVASKLINKLALTELELANREVDIDELNEKLEEFNEIKSTVSELIKVTNNVEIELSKSNSNTELIVSKLNAQLDAQCAVWSTIKDDKLRELVTNIVTNAKYLETSDVSNLRKQLIELEQKLSEQADNIKKDVADTVKQVNKTVKSNDTIMRA